MGRGQFFLLALGAIFHCYRTSYRANKKQEGFGDGMVPVMMRLGRKKLVGNKTLRTFKCCQIVLLAKQLAEKVVGEKEDTLPGVNLFC